MANGSKQFEGVLDDYFETFLKDHPAVAAVNGLRFGEGHLGRANHAFEQRQHRLRRKTLAAMESISPRDLNPQQQLDRLALRAKLLRENEDFHRKRSSLEPAAIDHVLNLLLHELIRGEDEPARAAGNIRSILKETPNFLSEAAVLIDRPEGVWRKVMEQSSEGAPSLFQAIDSFLQRAGGEPPDSARLRSAAAAINQYRDTVMERALAKKGSFSVGADVMQRRVRDELGLDYTLGEIEALAQREIDRVGALLKEACRPFGRGKRPEQIIEKARAEWKPTRPLLEEYQRETSRIKEAFARLDAVTFPKAETLEVRPVPEFMRHLFPTAAYTAPGAFEKRQRGIFWVNDLSVTKRTDEEKRQERAQHFGLSLTCAHEAYPGHHLQFAIANQHPRRWRRLFAHAVFYEGWTLWCEQMMVDLKVDRSPWLIVQQLHDALWRCHRVLVDLRLQTGRYPYKQAVKHMETHLGFTRSRGEADVNWYTASPAVPMSYWLGRLENERLRQRLIGGRKWKLKQFNNWLLSFGTLPQAWLEKYGLD